MAQRTRSARRKVGIVLLALLALSLAVVPSPAAAAEGEPRFCESTTLHDYLAPLKRMPELRERPYRRISEPFFRGVRIGAAGPTLAVNGGKFGYQFQWDANPRWDVTLTLARVNGNGKVIEMIGQAISGSAGSPPPRSPNRASSSPAGRRSTGRPS
jgi:hypothetical protein